MDQFAGLNKQALGLWLDVTSRSVQSDGPDLTARQTALMLTVYLEAGPHTVRALAQRLGVGKPAIVRAIDTLQDVGLVERRPDPADRRNIFVVGTEAGAERLSTYAASIARNIAEITQVGRTLTVDESDEAIALQKLA
ncbi:MarR family transcriptional regulator [Aquidulcibacter sp.]|uniref:MarR family winged helix-turn-helix transcriptional regulator n=1 Tax=Aquidulcibacter sp. TaxID=2052990 RepID=UPI0025B8A0F8|nr:MarR family transcriptional regulator [Aquidulcibacter sp.]MCA3695466.1 MarR family transcriptional regulator [Aquidulcibacter sp.]